MSETGWLKSGGSGPFRRIGFSGAACDRQPRDAGRHGPPGDAQMDSNTLGVFESISLARSTWTRVVQRSQTDLASSVAA